MHSSEVRIERAEATIDAGNYTGALSLGPFGNDKVIKIVPFRYKRFGPWTVVVLLYEALRQAGGQAD